MEARTGRPATSIHVANLSKHYRIHRRETGLRSSLRNLLRREYETVRAVDGVSSTWRPARSSASSGLTAPARPPR